MRIRPLSIALLVLAWICLALGAPFLEFIGLFLFIAVIEYGVWRTRRIMDKAEAAMLLRRQKFADVTRMYLRIILSVRPDDFQTVLEELQRDFGDDPVMQDVLSHVRQLKEEL